MVIVHAHAELSYAILGSAFASESLTAPSRTPGRIISAVQLSIDK